MPDIIRVGLLLLKTYFFPAEDAIFSFIAVLRLTVLARRRWRFSRALYLRVIFFVQKVYSL
jgi:hypothetical protein